MSKREIMASGNATIVLTTENFLFFKVVISLKGICRSYPCLTTTMLLSETLFKTTFDNLLLLSILYFFPTTIVDGFISTLL